MSDPIQREWRFYLDDMIEFARKVLTYTDEFEQADFVKNGLIYDATLRNLELIGEAATHIPDEIRAAHTEIPWRMIIATRNQPLETPILFSPSAQDSPIFTVPPICPATPTTFRRPN